MYRRLDWKQTANKSGQTARKSIKINVNSCGVVEKDRSENIPFFVSRRLSFENRINNNEQN